MTMANDFPPPLDFTTKPPLSGKSWEALPLSGGSAPKPRPGGSLLASAHRITSKNSKDRVRGTYQVPAAAGWQSDAWDMYDMVGEQRFLTATLAGRTGQARFYVGTMPESPTAEPDPTEDQALIDLFDSLGGTAVRWHQMVVRQALNLLVAGEVWLVGIPPTLLYPGSQIVDALPTEGGPDLLEDLNTVHSLEWHVLSVSEVMFLEGNRVRVNMSASGAGSVEAPIDDLYLIRIWRPHPRWSWEAESPTRSCLPTLRELVGLTMHIGAQIDSRLAGAGLLFVPQTASAALKRQSGLPEDSEEDPFTESLMQAMLTPIQDRGVPSALVPLIVTAPDESIDKFRYMSFSGPLDAEARELRDEAIRRLALGQDAPPELLLGVSGMNHWGCVDTETEILTKRGWQTLDTLEATDVVLTLNHDTGLSEWQEMEAVQRYEVKDAPMLRMTSLGHDSLTTMNHRWAVTSANHERREFVVSGELNTGHRIPTAAPSADLPDTPKHSDYFVELVAWFWTEGWMSKDGKRGCLAQSMSANPDNVDSIRRALDQSFPAGWGREYRQAGEWGSDVVRFDLRVSVMAALAAVGGKYPTTDFITSLTRSQLELFIRTSCSGDGWHNNRGELDIWQRDPEALDAFELALILSGRMVSRTRHAGGECVYGYSRTSIRPVKASRQAANGEGGAARMTEEMYTGTIWCPTTPNGTWLARRNGTVWYTGNSWLVREDVVTTHLEPPLALICDALTSQFLHPVMAAMGYPQETIDETVIWYSVGHMVVRPNRTADAERLYDKGVLSDEALREAAGFDDLDSPGLPDARRIALTMVQARPELLVDPGLAALVDQLERLTENRPLEDLESTIPVSAGESGVTGEAGPAPVPEAEGGTPSTENAPMPDDPETGL